jgi:hypothetical protein
MHHSKAPVPKTTAAMVMVTSMIHDVILSHFVGQLFAMQ